MFSESRSYGLTIIGCLFLYMFPESLVNIPQLSVSLGSFYEFFLLYIIEKKQHVWFKPRPEANHRYRNTMYQANIKLTSVGS